MAKVKKVKNNKKKAEQESASASVKQNKKLKNKKKSLPIEEVEENEIEPNEEKEMDVTVKTTSSKKSLKRKLEQPAEDNKEENEEEIIENDQSDSGEDLEDEEGDSDLDEESDHDADLMNDDAGEGAEFDFEAFPMEEGDKEGIVNMLTQIFLRTDVDVVGIAEALVKISPFGSVIGPAEDNADEESANVVYAILSAIELDMKKKDCESHVKSVVDFLIARAKKYALKDVLEHFELLSSTRVGFLINERMLHFPSQIVGPSFSSLRIDVAGMKKPFKNVVYIQKLRVAEASADEAPPAVSGKKKKKLGKAAKKRLAAAALEKAEIIFDNTEDEELFKLTEGNIHYFDYPVHNDVEPDSKFHIIEKDGKKYKPFRRAIVMDQKRFEAFLKKLSTGTIV